VPEVRAASPDPADCPVPAPPACLVAEPRAGPPGNPVAEPAAEASVAAEGP